MKISKVLKKALKLMANKELLFRKKTNKLNSKIIK